MVNIYLGVCSRIPMTGAFLFSFLLTFFLFFFVSEARASAPMEDWHLKGIDTIAVSVKEGPQYGLLHDQIESRPEQPGIESAAVNALKELFRREPRVVVVASRDLKEPKIAPNILFVTFILTVQLEMIDNKPVKVAALLVRYERYQSDNKLADMKAFDASFPFLVPDNYETFLKKIEQGAHYLTEYFPAIYYCHNTEITKDNKARCSSDVILQDPWLIDTFRPNRRY